MIIGISGKIGSGKDTVGKIIQYLSIQKDYPDFKFEDYNTEDYDSDWKIVKFADKLKQCISIITGIPKEDLEKIEVKNSSLGEEWIRYGYADSFYRDMDGTPIMNNKQCTKEEYVEHYRVNWQTAYKHEYTVRELLQLFGTEVGRSIHLNFWVNALFTDYHCITSTDQCEGICGKCTDERFPNWIITDMRYPNELKAIKDRDGISIRINRDKVPLNGMGLKEYIKQSEHTSETALDNATFDYTIDNNGTIEELIEKVKEILIKEKII